MDDDGPGGYARDAVVVAYGRRCATDVDARQLQGNGIEKQQTDGCGEDKAGG